MGETDEDEVYEPKFTKQSSAEFDHEDSDPDSDADPDFENEFLQNTTTAEQLEDNYHQQMERVNEKEAKKARQRVTNLQDELNSLKTAQTSCENRILKKKLDKKIEELEVKLDDAQWAADHLK